MKKRLFLSVVPALLLLGSCAGATPKVEEPLFQEDTLAHEEIFGGIEEGFKKTRLNAGDIPEPFNPAEPKIGVQSVTTGTGEDARTSIRFVAAVTIGSGEMSSTTAVWNRTMYYGDVDGTENDYKVFKATAPKASTKAYIQLYDGESGDYTIEQFNAAHGGTEYTHFVIYTMLNIPTDAYADYTLTAQLVVNSGTPSNIVATTVDQGARASFGSSEYGLFLSGTMDGETHVTKDGSTKGDYNYASFTTDLNAGDNFVVVETDASHTSLRLYSGLGVDAKNAYYFNKTNGRIYVNYSGSYTLYLNDSQRVLWSHAEGLALVNAYRLAYGTTGGSETTWSFANGLHGESVTPPEGYTDKVKYTLNSATQLTAFQVCNVEGTWKGAEIADAPYYKASGDVTPDCPGDYYVYLSLDTSGNLHISVELRTTHTLTIDLTKSLNAEGGKWTDGNAVIYAYCWEGDDGDQKREAWYVASSYTSITINGAWTNMILVRKNPANPDPGWEGKWNQSGDLVLNETNYAKTLKVTGWDYSTEWVA